MGELIIVLGDTTSHGGTVVTSSSFAAINGKGWARVGDMVSCPRCKGVFPICQGNESHRENGKAVAYHGCKVACGATLIASQTLASTSPSCGHGTASQTTSSQDGLLPGFGQISAGLAGAYQDETTANARGRYRGRFRVVDAVTGRPVSGQAVRIWSTHGGYLTGCTDSNGFTEWIERDAHESLAFDLGPDGLT